MNSAVCQKTSKPQIYQNCFIRRNTISSEGIVDLFYYLLIVVCTLYYRGGGAVKAGLIALIVVVALFEKRKNFGFNRTSLIMFLNVLVCVIATIHGMFTGNKGEALRSATVNVLWPLLYCIFSGYELSDERLMKFYRGLCYILTVICISDTLVLISGITGISFINSILDIINLGGISGASSGVFFRSDHMYLYAFFAPFIISCFSMDKTEIEKTGLSVRYVYLLAVYTGLIAICTGMGAIWLATFVGVIISVLVSRTYKRRKLFVIIVTCVTGGIIVACISYVRQGFVYYIVEDILSRAGVNGRNVEGGTTVRINQISALLREWKHNPLFGRGIAATVRYVRDGAVIETSAFESSYIALLFQKGIVGLVVFFLMVARGMSNLRKRKEIFCFSRSFEIGLTGMLMANIFNPYLASISSIWILYFPMLTEQVKSENRMSFRRA